MNVVCLDKKQKRLEVKNILNQLKGNNTSEWEQNLLIGVETYNKQFFQVQVLAFILKLHTSGSTKQTYLYNKMQRFLNFNKDCLIEIARYSIKRGIMLWHGLQLVYIYISI